MTRWIPTVLIALTMNGAASSQEPAKPKAVICISVDQLRWDYLERFEEYFGKGGFNRLLKEGAASEDCRFPYAQPVTAAGHATLMTGVPPMTHGIVGNGFWIRDEQREVYCVTDESTKIVTSNGIMNRASHSPYRLTAPTVGEQLETMTDGKAITFAIAFKDRSAILMAGKVADGVYWFREENGGFVTSTYYAQELPQWIKDFNESPSRTRALGGKWDLSLPKEEYEKHCTVDDFEGEAFGAGIPRTMPKPFLGEANQMFYRQVELSPFGDLLTIEAALAGVEALGVGKDEVPDLVTVSLSCFDKTGHAFGPNSWEMMDYTIKLDQMLEELFVGLDTLIGEGQYVAILSADHGVAPLPEFMMAQGVPAARIMDDVYRREAEDHLIALFGKPAEDDSYLTVFNPPDLHVSAKLTPKMREDVIAQTLAWFREQPEIGGAYSLREIQAAPVDGKEIVSMIRRGIQEDRFGDIYVYPAEYHFFSGGYPAGTTHGSPFEYDQRVPLLAYGPGYGKSATPTADGKARHLLPDADSPEWMARLARRALGIPE